MSLGVFTPLTEAQHSGRVWILKSFLVCCMQCYLWSEFIKRSMITLERENSSSWISGGWGFFRVGRKLSINFMLYMLFFLWKSSHMYTLLLCSSLSAGLTRIHFPWSVLFSRYIWNSHCIDSLILRFKTCTRWQVHWVFSITHCSVLHVCRQCHCSGLYCAFWLKLGKHIFCSHCCWQVSLWHWSSLSLKLWLSFAIYNKKLLGLFPS